MTALYWILGTYAAFWLFLGFRNGFFVSFGPWVLWRSKAILSERERCARVAESATKTTYMMWDPEGKHPCVSPASDRDIIAAAIRKDPTCQE